MFDIAPTELLLCAVIALLVIGPKDLPKAMRVVGHWVGRAKGVARHFRVGFDTMVREAELEELEKKWASENERIKKEFPFEPDDPEKAADDEMRPLADPLASEAAQETQASVAPHAPSVDADAPPPPPKGEDQA